MTWSETVSLRTRPRLRPEKSVLVLHAVVLVLQVWCVVKHGLVTLAVIMILKYTATSQVLFTVSLFSAWNLKPETQWCGLRPSVLGQDRSKTKKSVLVLQVWCCFVKHDLVSCNARNHNDLEGHRNFLSPIYSFSVLCLEHHYCGDQQCRSLT